MDRISVLFAGDDDLDEQRGWHGGRFDRSRGQGFRPPRPFGAALHQPVGQPPP